MTCRSPSRSENREALVEKLAPHIRRRPSAEWIELLEAVGMPVGPILDIADVVGLEQTRARGLVVETEHPSAGPTRALGLPVTLSATPGGVRRPAPLLGEHTRDVLREVGYAEAEIDALVASGALVALKQ